LKAIAKKNTRKKDEDCNRNKKSTPSYQNPNGGRNNCNHWNKYPKLDNKISPKIVIPET